MSFTLTSTQHIVVVLHMTSTTECVTILGREIQTKFDIEKTLFSSPSHPPTIEWQYYLSRESCWSPKILLISSFIFPISSGHEWEYSQDRIGTHSGRKGRNFKWVSLLFRHPSDSHINMCSAMYWMDMDYTGMKVCFFNSPFFRCKTLIYSNCGVDFPATAIFYFITRILWQ